MAAAEAVALLEALKEQVAAVTEHGRGLLRRVRGGRLRTEKGLSVLEARGQALLCYLLDVGLLLGVKARGASLVGQPALPRLLETRVVLEKLRPIEQRLKYQLEKLLRAAGPTLGGQDANDPLRFRPSPHNMEEEGAEPEGGGGAKAPGLGGGRRYLPPRLVPVTHGACPEGACPEGAWSRRRALSSRMLRELREELGEGPGLEGGGAQRGHAQRRRRLEESLFLRLRRGRGHGEGAEPRRGGGALASITHLGDMAPLLDPANQDGPPPKRKRKRKVLKGRKKGFRRRRR